uniref:Nanos-type domain-containing protein n=1 Tax=Oncorhynchus mykiss TaxID=8022 RepID=A0A8C7T126_ONCMY
MESENKSFEPWRDYMKLADLVREMQLGKFTPEPSTVEGHDSGIWSTMFCSFCKYNGQPESVFLSHSIKNQDGDMMCRYLQLSLCPLCGVTGAQAATMHHCSPLV